VRRVWDITLQDYLRFWLRDICVSSYCVLSLRCRSVSDGRRFRMAGWDGVRVWENGRAGLAYRYQDLDVVDGVVDG
jgi:hypothetical protein